MTAAHSNRRDDSTAPTNISSQPNQLSRPAAGVILTNADDVALDDARVGSCVVFPSGRVAAELCEPYASELPAATRHFHWRDEENAVEALERVVETGDVWIEWTR